MSSQANVASGQAVIDEVVDLSELQAFAAKVATILDVKASDQTIVWLEGDLGAGKTAFTKSLLVGFGLKKEVVVQSPTFTYINEYMIEGGCFAHCDFYRCSDTAFAEELLEYRDFKCILIEWPKQVSDAPSPDYVVKITKLDHPDERHFKITRVS